MRRIIQLTLNDKNEFGMAAEGVSQTDVLGMLELARMYADELFKLKVIEAVGKFRVEEAERGR